VTELGGAVPGEGIGPGTVIVPEGPIVEEAPPATFVPHEVPPAVAVRVDPVYPPVAIRAELEGNVFVRVWVDRQGLVRSAEVVKSDGQIFDASALEAVRQWVFTPARMQDRPVSVWVTIPIRFRLRSSP
jgi:protein TonB